MKRMKVNITFLENGSFPINYNHILMGIIYKAMKEEDPHLAELVHSSKKPKFFTFSQLRIDKKKISGDRIVVFKGSKAHFILSSADDFVVDSVFNHLAKSPLLNISEVAAETTSINVFDDVEIKNSQRFKLLSPLVISIPVKNKGKLYHRFLSPLDEQFAERFIKNLKKKYSAFSGKEAKDVKIIVDENYVKNRKTSKLLDIKGVKIKGHVFPFTLEGDPELIKFGYYAGFGERTAQGFGCAEIVGGEKR